MKSDIIANGVLFIFVVLSCLGALWWVLFVGSLSDGSVFAAVLSLAAIGSCWLIYLVIRRIRGYVRGCQVVLIATSLLAIPLYFQPWTIESKFKSEVRSQNGKSMAEAQNSLEKFSGGIVVHISEAYRESDEIAQIATHACEYREGYWHGWLYFRDGKVVGTALTWD